MSPSTISPNPEFNAKTRRAGASGRHWCKMRNEIIMVHVVLAGLKALRRAGSHRPLEKLMDRRKLMRGAVSFMVLPPTVAVAGASAGATEVSLLSILLSDRGEAVRLGRMVIEEQPDAATLGCAMLRDIAGGCGSEPSAVRAAFRQRTTAQFAALDISVVDGWVLARGEAELFAAACEV